MPPMSGEPSSRKLSAGEVQEARVEEVYTPDEGEEAGLDTHQYGADDADGSSDTPRDNLEERAAR